MIKKFNEPKNILFSGGVESSLLLYFLLSQQPNTKTNIFTVVERKKNYHILVPVTNVIQWCINKTGNLNIDLIIKYIEYKNDNFLEIIHNEYNNGYVTCFGVNANPPHMKWNGPKNDPRSSPGEKSVWIDKLIYAPFINIDKKDIVNLYKKNSLVELYNLTLSCNNPVVGNKPCRECGACKEREYGEGR